MGQRVEVKTEMLEWAIHRAGLDLFEFSKDFPKITSWLDKSALPTFKQLEKFAKKVYVPFGYLFLDSPPEEENPLPYFRTLTQSDKRFSINVYDTIIDLQQRQEWLRDYLKDNGEEPLKFVGKFDKISNITSIVDDIRRVLGVERNWASHYSNWTSALNGLVESIENTGIITVFNGVYENNNYRKIPVSECRGFVLVDEYAPFLFVNNSDAKAAQLFTIVHELAHIWTGHSAAFDFQNLLPSEDPIEQLCDKIAAEFLVPEDLLRGFWENNYANYESAARYFKVSQIVVARRVLDLEIIDKTTFFKFYNEYMSTEITKKSQKSGGGDFYLTTGKRISYTFASHIKNAVSTGQLLYNDAYRLTNLRGDTFNNFMKNYV